ncbi:MAG: response regulator [Cyanobacteria bacterium J06638_22]
MRDNTKILVVDDTPANLEVVTETLSSQGYITSAVTSGERALKWLETYEVDLILLDVQMPGIDGFETCKKIKLNIKTADIPIIFITALSDVASTAKGFSLGAVDYISKPFQEAELLARVNTHLKLQRMHQSLEQKVAERTQDLESAMIQLKEALSQLKESQLQRIQQEKMSALGNLVAGIAHEINNPLGFVRGNIKEVSRSLSEITECLQCYQKAFPEPGEEIEDLLKGYDIDFVLEDLPKMLASMQVGCDRIRSISTSLRTFSRADTEVKFKANLHEGIDSALLILKYRLKATDSRPEIEIIRDYDDLPDINCFPGQLNQVFMNLLANAIDMFDEVAEANNYKHLEKNPQKITLQTRLVESENAVEIHIADNGKGIPKETLTKIFDRQFTTKAVGKGTGLGLAIAQQIVVDTHSGSLNVRSEIGKETEFRIQLPID